MRNLELLVMAGQSNMVGAAPIPPSSELFRRVWVFGNDDKWKRFKRELVDSPRGQVDLVSKDELFYAGFGPGCGYGPATGLSRGLKKLMPQADFGIIPCAKGGSSMNQWQRNLSASSLYGSMLRRIVAAQRKGSLKAILFYQGEQDSASAAAAGAWVARFTQFVSDIRSDVGFNVPVIFVKLPVRTTPHPWCPEWDLMRSEMLTVAISGVHMVDVDEIDMELTGSSNEELYAGMHLSAAQYDIVGLKLAQAVKEL